MIKGLDNGYKFTKDNALNIFKSAYSEVNTSVVGAYEIEIDGKNYYVGVGEGTVDVDKIESNTNKICTLTDLCLSNEDHFKLVVGLPIRQYNESKDRFAETIRSYSKSHVIFGGKERKIHIDDVYVFPQGAAAHYASDCKQGDYILVDIGGLTIDAAYIEQNGLKAKVMKCDTWYKGMLTLFSNVIDVVNAKYGTTSDPEYAERILTTGLRIFGEKQSLEFLTPTLKAYIDPIVQELKVAYPFKTAPIYLCGGGATLLHPVFSKHFPDCKVFDNPQFANAIGMHRIGLAKWGDR